MLPACDLAQAQAGFTPLGSKLVCNNSHQQECIVGMSHVVACCMPAQETASKSISLVPGLAGTLTYYMQGSRAKATGELACC